MWILDELKARKDDCERIAIVHRDRKISYADLWVNSEKLAQWLDKSLHTSAPVLIYGNKDIEIVEIMLAVLKTGRAYVPIDVTFPEERVENIAKVTECEVLFDLSELNLTVSENVTCVRRAELAEIFTRKCEEEICEDRWVKEADNCYILFTSGSTGEPKGVQISKGNIVNFTGWFRKWANIEGDVVLNQVSYSFDVSVIQIYLYLAMGKTLFCIDKEMISDFGSLFEHLGNSKIAAWVSTPAFIEMCAVYDVFNEKLLPCLEKIILAGEILTKKLVKMLWNKFPKAEVINGYGPTEGTVLLTCCTIEEKMVEDEDNELPIGYILDDAVYQIDKSVTEFDKEKSMTVQEKGELIVSSKSISKGYFKKPDVTAKSFFFEQGNSYPSYRTGDVVYEKNGLLYYCGRKDFQIKLNGYRIELDDISENINKIDGISNNVVLPVYREGRVAFIAAFVMLNKDLGLTTAKTSIYIRKELANFVPSYMVPKKIVILEKFPLNTNGKIDRKLLRETYL